MPERVNAAIKLLGAALALGLAAMVIGYRSVTKDAYAASLAVSFPFFGIAMLALILAIERHSRPDARVVNSGIPELVRLLVLSGVWVFVVLFVWGL